MNVLEVGCGTGQITGWLASVARPGRVMAVDYSEAMLTKAHGKAIDAQFRKMDICRELPAASHFDVVFCFQCFPHLRDPVAALHAMAHGLNSAGHLIVLHLVGSQRLNAFHRHTGGEVMTDLLPAAEEWPVLLARAGFLLRDFEDKDDLFLLDAVRHPGSI